MPRTTEQNITVREQTSKKILEAAMKEFSKKGFHGTSMSDIAKAAGVSKGLAYNYFHSKKALLEAILGQFGEMGKEFESILDQAQDPYEKLKRLINYTFKYVEEQEDFWLLYMSLVFQPDVMGSAMKVIDEMYDSFYKMTEKIFRQIGVKNVVAEARIYGALFDGIFLGYFMSKDKYPLEKVRKQFLKKYSKEELQKLI